MLLVLRGNRAEALPLLERAVALGARDLAILIELARTYRLDGRPADAIRILEPAVAEAPAEPSARRELARARLEVQDYAAALAESNALIEELDLSSIRAHELGEIMDLYEVAAEAARGSGDAIRASFLYDALTGVLARHGRRDLVGQVRELERAHTQAFEQRTPEAADGATTPPIDALLRDAREYREHGQLQAALDACYLAMSCDLDHLGPFLELARVYLALDRRAEALAVLRSIESVQQLRGEAEPAPALLDLLGQVAGEPAQREQAVRQWLAQGEVAEAKATLTDLLTAARVANDVDAELHQLQQLRALEPRSDTLALDYAAALERRDGAAAAEAALRAYTAERSAPASAVEMVAFWQHAVERLPGSAFAREQLGDELIRRGRPESGAAALQRAADLRTGQSGPAAATLFLRLAALYDELGDVPAALRAYDRVLRLAPGEAAAQEHFVGFCLRRGRPDLAVRTLRALAQHLLSHGRSADAVAALTQIMVLQPHDAWAYEQLTATLLRQGRRQEAILALRQLAARRPQDAALQQRLRALGEVAEVGTRDATPGA